MLTEMPSTVNLKNVCVPIVLLSNDLNALIINYEVPSQIISEKIMNNLKTT